MRGYLFIMLRSLHAMHMMQACSFRCPARTPVRVRSHAAEGVSTWLACRAFPQSRPQSGSHSSLGVGLECQICRAAVSYVRAALANKETKEQIEKVWFAVRMLHCWLQCTGQLIGIMCQHLDGLRQA